MLQVSKKSFSGPSTIAWKTEGYDILAVLMAVTERTNDLFDQKDAQASKSPPEFVPAPARAIQE